MWLCAQMHANKEKIGADTDRGAHQRSNHGYPEEVAVVPIRDQVPQNPRTVLAGVRGWTGDTIVEHARAHF